MNGTDTSASVYAGAMPRPWNSAFIGRNIFGGSTSVGGTSPSAGSRRSVPQPFSWAAAANVPRAGSGIHPETYASSPDSPTSSFASSNAILSASAGYFLRIAFSSHPASLSSSMRSLFSMRSSFSRILESRMAGSFSGSSATSRSPSTSLRSFSASSGSKSPYGSYTRISRSSSSFAALSVSRSASMERTSATVRSCMSKSLDFPRALSMRRTALSASAASPFAAETDAPCADARSRCTAPRSRSFSKVAVFSAARHTRSR